MKSNRLLVTTLVLCCAVATAAAQDGRTLLWGDTHLHTSYSFDAFLNGNHTADPDTAYRWAKGMPVIHPYNRARVRIGTPLDFLVVSDHAEFLGGIRDIYLDGVQDEDPNLIERLVYWYRVRQIREAIDSGKGREYFSSVLPTSQDPVEAAKNWDEVVAQVPPGADVSLRNAWRRTIEAAEKYNQPGRFTALVGWEWSSVPGGANLHRVVFSDADAATAERFLPFGSNDSPFPDDLWGWLEKTESETGARFVCIPHNSNISKGMMFSESTLRGVPMDADYARTRAKWERVVEVTQIKGDSETHPKLSPEDEFADFELFPWYLQQNRGGYEPRPGDYARSALKTGLALEARLGVNPFRFGMIGSTDAHTGLSSAEEPNFWGKMATDSVPENKARSALSDGPSGWTMSASGIAGVWSTENTRGAIVDAFRRREVYATTGPRIRVRFFGGWDFVAADLDSPSPATEGYARGVPMGGELGSTSTAAAPSFMLVAAKDPASANLDRIQVVKGWLDADGRTHEKVIDAAWSEGRTVGPDGKLEPVGNTVDPATATWADTIGAPQLRAVWTDPDFDPAQPSFYYLRVLEIPTPRHSLYDAIALGLEAPTEGPAIIQERAYTSPIWYLPSPR